MVCRCDLYNATTDEDGRPLPEGYIGGLRCCGDGNMCALQEGFNAEERTFYLKVLNTITSLFAFLARSVLFLGYMFVFFSLLKWQSGLSCIF